MMEYNLVPMLKVSSEFMRAMEIHRLPYKKRIPRKAKKRAKKFGGRLCRDAQGFYLDQHIEPGVVIYYE